MVNKDLTINEIVSKFKKCAEKDELEKWIRSQIGEKNLGWYIDTEQNSIHFDMDVPPKVGFLMLERNTSNRKMNMGVVDTYSQDLRIDDWLYTGECIKFDWNGVMRDGQKRCAAICSVGKPMKVQVIWGVSPKSFTYIDTGEIRKGTDALYCLQFYKDKPTSSYLTYLHYSNTSSFDKRKTVTPRKQVELLNTLPFDVVEIEDKKTQTIKKYKVERSIHKVATLLKQHKDSKIKESKISFLAFLHNALLRKDGSFADDVIAKLISGAELKVNSPLIFLRDTLITPEREHHIQILKWAIIATHAYKYNIKRELSIHKKIVFPYKELKELYA